MIGDGKDGLPIRMCSNVPGPFEPVHCDWKRKKTGKCSMNSKFVTTSFSFDGYRIVEHLGVVRGIIVRSRSIVGNIIAGFEMLFGGKIAMYTQLCERTRQESFDLMVEHAMEAGRQRHHRHALRRQRGGCGRHRGALLRDRGQGREGVTGRQRAGTPRHVALFCSWRGATCPPWALLPEETRVRPGCLESPSASPRSETS